jgi:methylated-DNA-protein-cysteine methyltransferase-like protein
MTRRKISSTEFFNSLSGDSSRSRRRAQPDNAAMETIWHVVAAIPRGKASTYGAVARAAGLPGRARQTGYALKVAPDELHLPWHRVVGAGGRIVFAKSSRYFREQSKRLREEGILVNNGRIPSRAMADLD